MLNEYETRVWITPVRKPYGNVVAQIDPYRIIDNGEEKSWQDGHMHDLIRHRK